MNQLLKNALLPVFCFCLGFLFSCSKNGDNPAGGEDTMKLLSTIPEENATVSATTNSVSFVFDQAVYVSDKTKITLNGSPVSNTSVDGKSLKITISSLKNGVEYTLLIDKGAIRDGYNNLNNGTFSLKFKTKEAPIIGGSVSQHGFLSVSGTALVDQQGKDVVFHGVSFGWHNWWPRFYNENTVAWLKSDWKCDVLRAAIGVEPTDPPGGYLVNPTFALDHLYAVVDAAIKNDMYVIVDWHSHNIYQDEAIGFFQLVTEKYKDCPNIIYEIFNEPENISWGTVKAYSLAVIAAIRANAKKNIILVGSPHWDTDVDVAAADPVAGYDNLMYTLHFYAASSKQPLRDKANTALQKGLPLFVSECGGMEGSGDGAIDKQEWQNWLQWMSDNQISWTAWDIADKAESCSMIKDTSSPVSGWKDSDLKEWGQIVRTQLRTY